MRLFKVNLFANVNTWRGYDYQTVQIIVAAEEESFIKEIIEKNSEAVYEFFDKKRWGTKRLVGKQFNLSRFKIKSILIDFNLSAFNTERKLNKNNWNNFIQNKIDLFKEKTNGS